MTDQVQKMIPADEIQAKVDAYVETQSRLDLLRFITCGSVDDGKSTLIGRMLYEAQLIFEDQVTSLQKDSKKMLLSFITLDSIYFI